MVKKDAHHSPIFEGVDQKYIDQFLASLPDPVHIKASEYLWRQQDTGDSMYLLNSGKMEVLLNSSDKQEESVIATIESGAVIGEVCVLGEKYRSASIRAAEDSELWVIDGKKFQEKVREKDPAVLIICYNIAKLLTQRLIAANNFISKIQKMSDKVVKSEIETYRQRFYEESLFN